MRDEILRELIDVALPKLEQLAHDEALRDLWLSGRSPSLTDLQRLQNLAVLVAALGPRDHLGGVIAELRLRAPGPARFIEQKLNQTNATEA